MCTSSWTFDTIPHQVYWLFLTVVRPCIIPPRLFCNSYSTAQQIAASLFDKQAGREIKQATTQLLKKTGKKNPRVVFNTRNGGLKGRRKSTPLSRIQCHSKKKISWESNPELLANYKAMWCLCCELMLSSFWRGRVPIPTPIRRYSDMSVGSPKRREWRSSTFTPARSMGTGESRRITPHLIY